MKCTNLESTLCFGSRLRFNKQRLALFRNAYLTLLFLFLPKCNATTVVLIVTHRGIVIGADGETTNPVLGTHGTAVKVILLKKRLIVANRGLQKIRFNDDGTILYSFPSLIGQIDNQTSGKVSVDGLTAVIKKQIPTAFSLIIDAIKSGRLTHEQAVKMGLDPDIVQYIIAGYQRGIPIVYSLSIMPDWNTKTVNGPVQVVLNPTDGSDPEFQISNYGLWEAIDQIKTTDTKEQKEFAARVPVESRAIFAGDDLTLKQASNVARAMIGIEAEAEPGRVGLPFTIVTVPKAGNGWSTTYEDDTFSLSVLSITKPAKKKPKGNSAAQKLGFLPNE
jgi:hypothetical protein